MAKSKRIQDKLTKTSFPLVNRNYKDTVFRMLFSDRKNLLSLYNAVNSRDYTNPDDLEIVTLENAIYMGMKNDLAFIIDTNLYLYEHQSTYNPNMPLRDLFYISSEYQKCWIKNLYTHPACKRYLLLILLSFIMVLIQFAMFLSTDFPLLLNICRVSQNWN